MDEALVLLRPAGLLWVALIVLTIWAWRVRRRLGQVMLLFLLGFTLAGNSWLALGVLIALEGNAKAVNVMECGPFDALVVPSGGTRTDPHGYAHTNSSGDPVVLAARLFLSGRAATLVCSGEVHETTAVHGHPADECRAIWRSLGVPADKIVRLGGVTRADEATELAEAARERGWRRVGLCTLSRRVPRHLALMAERGVQAEGVPSGVVHGFPAFHAFFLVPRSQGFVQLDFALAEVWGMLLGR